MVKKVTSYEASDGATFKSQAEAEAHERELQLGEAVGAYLDTLRDDEDKPLSDRAKSRQRNVIVAWEAWRRGRESEARAEDTEAVA